MNSLCYRYQSQYQSNVQQVPNNPLPNMSSQRFCLRWNNHQSNLLSVFDQLLHDESFVDVTLAVDGKLLRAHKMVLSACSPYFQTLFVNHPDKDPIVILKDVPYNDMKSLLDFMYRGEVSVDQDRLTAFLKVAESLRIKGLTEVNEEKCDSIALTQNQHHGNAQLQRFMPQKRFANSNMLSNALMQPKRKRGRPRKLSGSSNGTPGEDFDRSDGLVQGSPELLEVKMGMDGFTGNHSDSSSGKDRDNDLDENCKDEEPTAGTSKETSFSNSISKSENDFSPAEDQSDYPENDQNHSNLPDAITVEVIPVKHESVIISTEAARNMLMETYEDHDHNYDKSMESSTGVHFLTDDEAPPYSTTDGEKKRNELLEYLLRDDGSVVCKLCGEILASRTHWYRHKYKLHVNSLGNPAPLFKCTHCNVFFKSRKGYTGHVSARHSDNMEQQEELNISIKEEVVETETKPSRRKEIKGADWEEQRVKEEKLVADIIDRVRRECEAQGAAVTRRGYSRRSTVMMNS
ncbi:protein tramtrack, beta isoform isoform X1 [Onthophagus taurus]|uniref:protein tramtrack, beta isoform isoform X1 n=1 Tax=Onthophagus taurus TaxID=166361 RepID=UPI000C20EF42|nr:protein tramtrack, beta isoform-like isoform X1 [Onthophagus taurus]XP_022918791.1 protein tramtrack, beta isoform-like isoform X1 [Onthophagus taurus]XP_022918792.1 protein tramtrack, beta isoform-like isoform X1 [Onthophagus taurus]